jgi:hypothetical protein
MAGGSATSIEVVGLRDLNRALRAIDSDAPKGLRLALNSVAEEFAGDVRPKIPRRSGRAAGSLKVASTRTSARVKAGGPRARYYPWLDFGGRVGPRKSVVRRFYREGRYIYPTLRENRGKYAASIERALAQLVEDSGLEVDG